MIQCNLSITLNSYCNITIENKTEACSDKFQSESESIRFRILNPEITDQNIKSWSKSIAIHKYNIHPMYSQHVIEK